MGWWGTVDPNISMYYYYPVPLLYLDTTKKRGSSRNESDVAVGKKELYLDTKNNVQINSQYKSKVT